MSAILPVRKRKNHRKSRAGCSNCKLRRVKCDESKPQCNKCQEFHVTCTYDGMLAVDSIFSSSHAFSLRPVVSTHESMLGMILDNHSLRLPVEKRSKVYRFNYSDLETLERFQYRTVNTIGTIEVSRILKDECLIYACKDPPMMHALLAITLAHDRFDMSPFAQPFAQELFHVNQAIQAISVAICNPNSSTVPETIWATATIMGAVAFCTLEGKHPEDFWPMHGDDLCWLKMSEGKAIMHKMMDLTDLESPVNKLAKIHHTVLLDTSLHYEKLTVLPARFLRAFGITRDTKLDNPYYTAICFLAQLWPLEANRSSILRFITFIMKMDPGFRRLLLAKDARALLAMAWWWSMVNHFQIWWHGTRARLECQATCLYLARYHSDKWYIREFLPFAQAGCGLWQPKSPDDYAEVSEASLVSSIALK